MTDEERIMWLDQIKNSMEAIEKAFAEWDAEFKKLKATAYEQAAKLDEMTKSH